MTKRKPKKEESKLVASNNEEVDVEFIGVICLNLAFGFKLVLNNTFYVLSFRRNLVFVSILDKEGYAFEFKNSSINLSFNSKLIENCSSSYGLYRMCLAPIDIYATSHNVEKC